MTQEDAIALAQKAAHAKGLKVGDMVSAEKALGRQSVEIWKVIFKLQIPSNERRDPSVVIFNVEDSTGKCFEVHWSPRYCDPPDRPAYDPTTSEPSG